MPLPAVIIPVFNAPEALARCIAALAATVPVDARVVLIDDASTDPQVATVLQRCPGAWTRLHQDRNRGFVATVNRGMALTGADDVVLLNADTVPAGDWLERLAACAAADQRIASATPFTNNGEIASLPEFCRAAPVPPQYPEIPTAVGFCMYMRRAAIDSVGDFDAATFGRGYGEENDWCMRTSASGWKHVLCDDAFVAHLGNASFGPLGLAPDEHSMRRLLDRHPDYLERIRAFIDADPIAPHRLRVLAQLGSVRAS